MGGGWREWRGRRSLASFTEVIRVDDFDDDFKSFDEF